MTPPDTIHIRPLTGLDEFVMAEDLQRDVWQMDVDTSLVPSSMFLPISKNGGVVYGAFDGESLVGLVFGFIGRSPAGHFLLWSHLNAVLPALQGQGLGEKLKWAQRDATLAIDIDLIRWTVDPLESRNATLNFGKLGGICRTYERNVYGNMQDGLNQGIESDRFVVDWELDSERVKKRQAQGAPALTMHALESGDSQYANLTQLEIAGVRRISESRLNLEAPQVIIEIPRSYQDIKVHDRQLAVRWREQTRELFETYFVRGYVVTEFVSERFDGERRSFYLLKLAGN